MKTRKSWNEKLLNEKGLPKVAKIEGKMTKRWGTGRMVIPAPIEVKELMDRVPKGKLVTINELRIALARNHHASIACPVTTGIFAWIAAHAAEEAASGGAKRITPYWRTLKSAGELNPKYPGGIKALQKRIEAEGHRVVQRGKKFFVFEYEKRLCSF